MGKKTDQTLRKIGDAPDFNALLAANSNSSSKSHRDEQKKAKKSKKKEKKSRGEEQPSEHGSSSKHSKSTQNTPRSSKKEAHTSGLSGNAKKAENRSFARKRKAQSTPNTPRAGGRGAGKHIKFDTSDDEQVENTSAPKLNNKQKKALRKQLRAERKAALLAERQALRTLASDEPATDDTPKKRKREEDNADDNNDASDAKEENAADTPTKKSKRTPRGGNRVATFAANYENRCEPDTHSQFEAIRQQLRGVGHKKLSVEEVDLFMPPLTSLAPLPPYRQDNDLLSHLDTLVGKPKLCAKKWQPNEIGAPLVLIVCVSALRACFFNDRLLKEVWQNRRGGVANCFAKHRPIDQQVKFLKVWAPSIAVGTPQRIQRLVDMGALKLDRIEYILIDGWKNAKEYTVLTMPETKAASVTLLQDHLLPRLRESKSKLSLW